MPALLPGPPAAPTRLLPRWRHAREWAASCALVLAAHALLLGGWDSRPPPLGLATGDNALRDTARLPPLLVVSHVTVEQAGAMSTGDAARTARNAETAHATGVEGATPSAAASPPAAAVAPTPATPLSGMGAAPSARVAPEAATEAGPKVATTEAATEPAMQAASRAALAPPYAGAPPPVWTTRVPGDFTVAYTLRRGEEAARPATLRFESREGRYTLQLQVGGAARGPEQASQGRIDPVGLVPERYLDRRRARSAAAANFDPSSARITYSGASAVQPLFAGAQDRLSWVVQLAAVLEADPTRAQAGARLPLYVSGARGDAQLWAFEVRRHIPKEGSGSTGDAFVHLVREPERPYDLRVEAWLDPAQQHLPARLRLTPVPAGAPLEWWRLP